MTLKLPRIAAGLALSLSLLAACGAPGSFDVCNARCDALRRCNYKNDAETTNCHTSCNNAAGLHAQADIDLSARCANANDIRQQELNCLNNSDSCTPGQPGLCQLNALGNCVQK